MENCEYCEKSFDECECEYEIVFEMDEELEKSLFEDE